MLPTTVMVVKNVLVWMIPLSFFIKVKGLLWKMYSCHLTVNFPFVCVEAAAIPMSATDKMKIRYDGM